jgi:hypothetical protein
MESSSVCLYDKVCWLKTCFSFSISVLSIRIWADYLQVTNHDGFMTAEMRRWAQKL